MKPLLLLSCVAAAGLAALSGAGCTAAETTTPAAPAPAETKPAAKKETMTLHDFTVLDITGKERKLSEFKGKPVLLVNTASKCGYTRQFDGLEKLYQSYKAKGLVVLGFPSNDFGGQDPGSNEEIATFCKANYGVTFPMMSKIPVKGEAAAPLYKWLTSKEIHPETGGPIGWNFHKFLVNQDGAVVARFDSKAEPGGPQIKAAVEKVLG